MGLERNAAALLLKMRSDGVRFGRVVTLGRQHAHLDRDMYARVLARAGLPAPAAVPTYADALLAALGATSVDAIDASGYQGATVVHDLNQPLPAALRGQFDLVFDGGTLEHIFDVAAAMKSCMELVRPHGRFVSATIPNNWCGHGFYQFSPELFFRAFGPENGFSIVEMYIATVDGRRAYRVHDPAAVGARVELCNHEPLYLLVHARRDAVRPIFAAMPQQSDYVRDWSAGPPAPGIPGVPGVPGVHDRPVPVAGWKTLPLVKHVRRARQRLLARQRWRQHALTNRRFYTPADLRI